MWFFESGSLFNVYIVVSVSVMLVNVGFSFGVASLSFVSVVVLFSVYWFIIFVFSVVYNVFDIVCV